MPATTCDIGESLSIQQKREKQENRQCFIKILSSLRFLARQGLAFRGHGDGSQSNVTQLLALRAVDDSSLARWLKKKTDKYTSGDIQNEVLSVIANNFLCTIVEEVKAAKFCSIMVDETPDIANKDQVL